MASDLAMVFGRTGTSTSVSFLIMVTMGPQPKAWAAYILVLPSGMSLSSRSSLKALAILVMSEPPAQGTTTCAGARQPSCSAISYAVFCLKKKKNQNDKHDKDSAK